VSQTFDTLGLRAELLRALADAGYTTPTPVQAQAIPVVLQGRDVLAGAQTGTGKTAGFTLPLLQRLHEGAAQPAGRPSRATRPVRALILVPTRELAAQVEESVRTYGKYLPLTSATIFGGVSIVPQIEALRRGVDILVATPGRLLDHISQRTVDLSAVEILVLDEADRMLDMGFIRDIRRILALLPARRQNLLFSATFSADIRALADGFLDRPATVDVSPRVTSAELVDQLAIPVDRHRKRDLLSHLARSGRVSQALVFTRTKHGANRLAEQLATDGIRAAAIHGNKSQGQRVRALADFKAGRVDLLVATDIAARGLDIEALPHVVNYELPMVASDYVHRIGRTGRAGLVGNAISLVSVDEAGLLRDIQALLRRTLPSEVVPGFEPDRSIAPEPIRLRSGDRPIGRGGPAGRGAPIGRGGPAGRGAPGAQRRRQSAAPGRDLAPRRGALRMGDRPDSHPLAPARVARNDRQPVQTSSHGLIAMPGERLSRAATPATSAPFAPGAQPSPGPHRPQMAQRSTATQRSPGARRSASRGGI
jgi:ATP-dependent RNA helicase RhlE